jgi:replication factor C subunit 1
MPGRLIGVPSLHPSKVTTAPSGNTSYVIVGDNAGASKLKTIQEKNLEAITEDQFLDLIRFRKPDALDEKQAKAAEKEQQKIAEQAKAMEEREREEEKLRRRKEAALSGTGVAAKWVLHSSPLA